MEKQFLFYSTILIIFLLVASVVGCQQLPVPITEPTPTPLSPPIPTPTLAPTPAPVPTQESIIVIPSTTVEVIKNIEYGRVGNVPLLLDMYIPETPVTTRMPTIIYIHGGGWRGGDKALGSERSNYLVKHGFLFVSINYRLIKAAQGSATFLAELEDCVEDSKCAVRWLRANAEKYNVDPDRIGVWGTSAGGHLAMMVACANESAELEGNGGWAEYSSRVQSVVSFFGPTLPMKQDRVSPINHVTTDDPPLLLIHGELDRVVSIESSEQMYEAYQQAGLKPTLVKVSGAGHGFKQETSSPISPSRDEIQQILLEFFIKHLVPTS
ncbi:alpha/beta hydrolase fold domain-containing protein [Chloroflexota bacterium]